LPLTAHRTEACGAVDLFDHTQMSDATHGERVVEAVQRAMCVAERPEDVVALAPLNADLVEIGAALEMAGIPSSKLERDRGVWSTPAGRAAAAMARAADAGRWTRFDAALVLAAIRRPLSGLDDAELSSLNAHRPLAFDLDNNEATRIHRDANAAGWWWYVANAPDIETLARLVAELRPMAGANATAAADAITAWRDDNGTHAPKPRDLLLWLGSSESSSAQTAREGCVVLSTLHGAKGLEWPEVVLVGASDGALPPQHVKSGDAEVENEWLRALYVGMTRASEGLAIVCPQMLRGKYRHPTRVLIDAGVARPNPNVEEPK
jgi:ATP-dependent exoDNAse (exonuclease V) beta subunit